MEKRDFKGVWIPKEVWLDERLNALEKIILVEIDSLDCEESGCYASYEYLATFCQCSLTKVSLGIKKLITLSYIYVVSFDGRTRLLKSRLSKNERQPNINLKADSQKMKDNNIDNNKENNNKKECKEKSATSRFIPPTLEEIRAYCEERRNLVDVERFYDFYQSKGWMVGKNKMKDWKASIRTWEREAGFKDEDDDPHGDFQMLGETDEEYLERMRKKEEKRKRKANGVF